MLKNSTHFKVGVSNFLTFADNPTRQILTYRKFFPRKSNGFR